MKADDRYKSRKWLGLWYTMAVEVVVMFAEALLQLKWPQFSIDPLPVILAGLYVGYCGGNAVVAWADARGKSEVKLPKGRKETV